MLKNCMNKHPPKIQTAMQDSVTENVVKNTRLMMWALGLFNLLKRRYLPSNPQNNWLYTTAVTKKKGFAAKSFLYIINVQSQSLTIWQVKIGLHQFDNCLSQVIIDLATVNNSCFLPYSRSLASSSSFSRTMPRHTEGRIHDLLDDRSYKHPHRNEIFHDALSSNGWNRFKPNFAHRGSDSVRWT